MTKKNILTAAVSLSLVACLSIGATLAYFTDKTETVQNEFTTGKVDIDVVDRLPDDVKPGEQHWDYNQPGGEDTAIFYTDVVPGDDMGKIVGVELMPNSEDSWIGLKVVVDADSAQMMADIANEILAAQDQNWTMVSTTYGETIEMMFAYNDVVTYNPKATNIYTLFSNIHIPESWDNAMSEKGFGISVEGYAVQADNVTYDGFTKMLTNGEWNGVEVEFN